MIDPAKLTPGPFSIVEDRIEDEISFSIECDDGSEVARFYSREDAEFWFTARQVEEIMTRHGWGVGFSINDGPMHGWYLILPTSWYPIDSRLYPLANLRRPDPFTILIDGYALYLEIQK